MTKIKYSTPKPGQRINPDFSKRKRKRVRVEEKPYFSIITSFDCPHCKTTVVGPERKYPRDTLCSWCNGPVHLSFPEECKP